MAVVVCTESESQFVFIMEQVGNITIVGETRNYEQVDRTLIRSLDPWVIGVYCKMMALGKSWRFYVPGLAKAIGLSKQKTRDAVNILEENGYITRYAVREESGRFKGWEYYLHKTPVEVNDRTNAGRKSLRTRDDYEEYKKSLNLLKSE